MPGQGKSLSAFRSDEGRCRSYANQGLTPSQAAAQAGVGTAVVSTAVGAGAGALVGSVSGHAGAGAAVGAGLGLLTGAIAGADNAAFAGNSQQGRYDVAYAQCMVAAGNTIPPGLMQGGGYYPEAAYAPYGYGYPYVDAPVVVAAPVFGWGWGGGWGWHRGREWWYRR